MTKTPEKQGPGKGGARPGAGKKRLYGKALTATVAASVPEPLIAKLDKWAKANSLNRSQSVAEAIKRLVS